MNYNHLQHLTLSRLTIDITGHILKMKALKSLSIELVLQDSNKSGEIDRQLNQLSLILANVKTLEILTFISYLKDEVLESLIELLRFNKTLKSVTM